MKCKRNNCNNEVIDNRSGDVKDQKVYCSVRCRRNDKYDRKVDKNKVKGFAVYYLPEEHYIGITNSVYRRMSQHRWLNRSTEGYEILCYYDRMVDAAALEVKFHQRGYNGFNTGKLRQI